MMFSWHISTKSKLNVRNIWRICVVWHLKNKSYRCPKEIFPSLRNSTHVWNAFSNTNVKMKSRQNLCYSLFNLFRLVINLMTINVTSCLLLFPAIIYDMQMSTLYSNSKTISFLDSTNNSYRNDEPLLKVLELKL